MKNGFVSWSDVRVFLAVVRAGSTLGASRVLGLAQPTVARRVEALEHDLGLTLFERDTRGFRPTSQGQALIGPAEAIEAAALGVAEAAVGLVCKRPIRITAPTGNFSPRVVAIFDEFSALHPDVELDFLPSYQIVDLMAGDADVALRLTRTQPDSRLICRKISTARAALYGAKAYEDKHGLPAGLSRLDGHSFVAAKYKDGNNVSYDWLMRRVAPGTVVRTYAEFDLMAAALKAGLGLGILNMRMAETDPLLVRCSDPIEELDQEHLMLVSPEAYRRPEVKEFTRFFAPRYASIFK